MLIQHDVSSVLNGVNPGVILTNLQKVRLLRKLLIMYA